MRRGTSLFLVGALFGCDETRSTTDAPPPTSLVASNASTSPQLDPSAPEPEGDSATPGVLSAGSLREPTLTQLPEAPSSPARVYPKTRNVWVRSAPSDEVQWIGLLWWGSSVAVRPEPKVSGHGCAGSWTAIEPRGWVCVDGERATLDPTDPTLALLEPFRPRVETPWPHEYAIVPRPIRRFLTADEARPFLAPDSPNDTFDPRLPPLPRGLSEMRTKVAARSAIAFAKTGNVLGTPMLVAADLSWVRKDDVELVPRIEFQGVALSPEKTLPLAFFRRDETPAYRRLEDGSFVPTGRVFERLGHESLESESVLVGKERFYRLQGRELWVSDRQAVIVESRSSSPFGEGPSTTRQTYLEISVLSGYLIAFENTRPVYATLISAGRGGTPVAGKTVLETASTPVGRFSVTGKFKTATMESSGGPIIHGDVPWTQNFSGPHAIHSAYWHDDWGRLKSAGCVNVAPRDGKWLFEFTEPRVPEGWHGARALSRYGPPTLIVIHD